MSITYKAACLLALATLTTTPLWAAGDDLDRNVTVEKDYVPTEVEANKINTVPDKEDYTPDKPVVTYSTWSQAEPITATPGKIKSDKFSTSSEKDARDGVFRAGFGPYYQVLGEFYYPILQGEKYLLDINLQHHSNWGKINFHDNDTDPWRPRGAKHNTEAALTFENQFKACRLTSQVDFSYNGWNYYGKALTDSTLTWNGPSAIDSIAKGTLTTVGINFGLFSTNTKKAFQYNLGLDYHYLGRNFGVKDHALSLQCDISNTLGEGKIGVNLGLQSNFMSNTYGAQHHNTGLFTINPYHKFVGKNWELQLGANVFFLAADSIQTSTDTIGRRWPVAGGADIRGQFGLVPGLFYLQGAISSKFQDNNYASLLQENRYINPDMMLLPTYTPLAIELGVKIKIMEGFLFQVTGEYELILNNHYFVLGDSITKTYANAFDAVYDPISNHAGVEGSLHYDAVKGLNLCLTARYNYWSTSEQARAWEKPNWEITFAGSYRFLKKWQVGLTYNMLAGRYAQVCGQEYKMKNIHDVNVLVNYQALPWLNVFLQGKNMLNIQADSYNGYRNMGINGLAGVTMTF